MSEYDELVEVLTFLLTKRLQAKLEFTRGLLGDGLGNTDVTDRDGFSFIRPDRSTSKVFEMFNKMAFGVDGTPILIGELPWQPGLIQVVGIDWETYMQIGWDSRFAGLAKHGNEHIWRDGQPGADTFNIFRRQMWPLRTEAVGSGSTSVTVNPYDYINHAGSRRAWPGAPGIDLSAALPASSGSQRYALVYWDYTVSGSVYGQLGVSTGTLAVNAPAITPSKPIEPVGSIPSAFVRLVGTQQTVTDLDIVDARPLWGDGSIFNIDRARVSKLVSPDDGAIDPVLSADIAGNVTLAGTGDLIVPVDILHLGDIDTKLSFTDDDVEITVGGLSMLKLTETTQDIVEIGDVGGAGDVDVDINSGQLFIRGSDGRVGVGTPSPNQFFHVRNSASMIALFEATGATTFSGFQNLADTASAINSQMFGSSFTGNQFGNARAETGSIFTDGAGMNLFTIGSKTAHDFVLGSSNLERMRITSAGAIGIGTPTPQAIFHIHETISGFIVWEFDGLDATVRTIIPNGTGDVLYRLTAMYVLRDSAAAVASGTTDVSNSASVNLTVGTNTVRLRVNADGSTDIARTAGSDTIKVALALRWL